jgi:hypothetical protein
LQTYGQSLNTAGQQNSYGLDVAQMGNNFNLADYQDAFQQYQQKLKNQQNELSSIFGGITGGIGDIASLGTLGGLGLTNPFQSGNNQPQTSSPGGSPFPMDSFALPDDSSIPSIGSGYQSPSSWSNPTQNQFSNLQNQGATLYSGGLDNQGFNTG